jgi:HSP20 family protein
MIIGVENIICIHTNTKKLYESCDSSEVATMAIIKRDPFDVFRSEMDSLFADMENRFQTLLPVSPAYSQKNRGLLAPGTSGFSVDIQDSEDEVTARADLPGCQKEMIKIRLLRSNMLQITCERVEEKQEDDKGFFIRERFFGSVSRSVPLPSEVTEEGAQATFENGILEVHFKKSPPEKCGDIPIS